MNALRDRRDLLFYAGVAAVVALFLYLTLPGLGALTFWLDEDYAALSALTILDRGVPSVYYDGIKMGTGASAANFLGLEASHGWASYYLCAASFAVFGPSEPAGRLPFLICAALAVAGVCLIGRELYGRPAGLVAGLVLATQPLFHAYSRQCRYYPLALLALVAVLWCYLRVRRGRLHWFWLSAALLLVFQSSQFLFPIVFGALAAVVVGKRLWRWRLGPSGPEPFPWVSVLIGTVVLVGPWIVFFSIGRGGGALTFDVDPALIADHFRSCGLHAMSIYPLLLLLGLVPVALARRSYLPAGFGVVACVLVAMLPQSVFDASTPFHERHYLFVLPLGALIAARGVALLRHRAGWVAALALALTALLPGQWDRVHTDANSLRANWHALTTMHAVYRDPPADPTRNTMRRTAELGADVDTILVDGVNIAQFVYELGSAKFERVQDVGALPAESCLVVQDPAFHQSPPPGIERCRAVPCADCKIWWLNAPFESFPPLPLSIDEPTHFWLCPAQSEEDAPGPSPVDDESGTSR